MKTLINDTIVTVDMMSFEDHTHDHLLVQTDNEKVMEIKPSKPFKVAYISLRSNERHMPVRDKLTCLVYVHMSDDYRPKLSFKVVEQEEHDENDELSCGGYTDEGINEILHDLSDGILYGEHDWKRNLYPN